MNEKTMTLTRMEAPTQLPARKRVAAYARVSTNSDEQKIGYEAQVSYYTDYISAKPDWDSYRFTRTRASPAPAPSTESISTK